MSRQPSTAAAVIYLILIGLAVALMCWIAVALGEVTEALVMAPADPWYTGAPPHAGEEA